MSSFLISCGSGSDSNSVDSESEAITIARSNEAIQRLILFFYDFSEATFRWGACSAKPVFPKDPDEPTHWDVRLIGDLTGYKSGSSREVTEKFAIKIKVDMNTGKLGFPETVK